VAFRRREQLRRARVAVAVGMGDADGCCEKPMQHVGQPSGIDIASGLCICVNAWVSTVISMASQRMNLFEGPYLLKQHGGYDTSCRRLLDNFVYLSSIMVARGKLLHDAIPARIKLRKFDVFGWLKLKLLQYNISSCLYMLDTWERFLFNFFFLVMLMLSVFLFVAYLSTASTTFLSGNYFAAFSLNFLTSDSQLSAQLLLSVSSC